MNTSGSLKILDFNKMPRKPKDINVRQVSLHVSDFQKVLQMLLWRGYDNRSEMLREIMSIACQYFKTQHERGTKTVDEFYNVSFHSTSDYEDDLKWLMTNKHFKKEAGAIRTSVRLAFQILEKLYGRVDELPQPVRQKRKKKNEKAKEK